MAEGAGVDEHFMREFIRSIEIEFSQISQRLYVLKASNNIMYSQGADMDNVAALLDINRFTQEDDNDFKSRILSYVNSLDACGTRSAFVQAFLTRFDYEITTEDITPIPTVKIWIDAQSIPGYDLSVIDTDDVEYLIERTKAAGVAYTWGLIIYVNNNSDVENMVIKEETSVQEGVGDFVLIWDVGEYDNKVWG